MKKIKKILFINPATRKDRLQCGKKPKGSDIFRYSKLGILTVAALTPKNIQLEFVDEVIQTINYDTNAEIIAISAVTALAPRSYEIAKEFKKKGKIVVMGGMHATFLSDECLKYVDSVVIGQAEGVWQMLIDDIEKGKLKLKYSQAMLNLPTQSFLRLPEVCRTTEKSKGYARGHVFGITRGCVHKCEFCSVRCFFKDKYYRRPIGDVVNELKKLPWKIINIVDDNIFGDPEYAKQLFRALIPLKKHLLFQASVDITYDDELMNLIQLAGGKGVFIGIESINPENLNDVNKFQNIVEHYRQIIKQFHKRGIVVEAGMMFGFDNDDKSVFKKVYQFADALNLDLMQIGIVTPMPGTPLYDKMKKQNRIFDDNWAHYDCKHVVFTPIGMTKEELEKGTDWIRKKFYSYPSIIKRGLCNFTSLGIIGTLGYYLRGNLGFRKNYKLGMDYPP